MKVLYVEDDMQSIGLVQSMLNRAGHRVLYTASVRIAIKLAYREAPDVILMDFYLPHMDGIQALKLIRSSERLASIPIVATTSLGNQNPIWFIEQGCDAFIAKPVNYHTLIETVEALKPTVPKAIAKVAALARH